MERRHRSGKVLGIALAVLLCSTAARAQDEQNADDPARGVARISVIQGDVNVRRGDTGEAVAAALNVPLMTEDHLQTGDGSRAEIQFDAANMVRLAPDTDVAMADVQRDRYQLQLGSGTVIFRVLRDSGANSEIDTPSVSVRPNGRGIFRVSVAGDGTTEVTVRSGTATIYSASGSQTLGTGQTMLARGATSDAEFQMEREIARDQFDDWSNNRDQQLLRSRSYQYVSTDIYGAEDLDAYGSWVSSSYGTVWAPRVAPGWAPYHAGRWVWEDYYGWTWIDDAPWGWAPFHYGRWFMNGSAGWCWWPGPIRQPHYWRPALVGFFGFGGGSGISVGIGFGNVGWVALAPYETWHPWYGRGFYGRGYSPTIVNNTIIHNTNIYNVYRNARINNGVAYTNVNSFGRGSQSFYAANGRQIGNASLVRGQVPITPARASLAYTNRAPGAMNYRQAPAGRFFAHTPAPQVQRMPFSQQQNQMAQYQQRTLGVRPALTGQESGGSVNSPAQRGYRPGGYVPGSYGTSSGQNGTPGNQSGNPGATSSGWRRFGQSPAYGTQQGGAVNSAGGWQRVPSANVSANTPAVRQQTRGNNGYNRPASTPSYGRSNNDSWQRFGAPQTNTAPRSAPASADGGASGWHRFGYPGDRTSGDRTSGDRTSGDRSSSPGPSRAPAPSRSFGDPRGYSRRDSSGSPMRMEQPIVHDRPSYSSPRAEQPRYSAPRSNSAPSNMRHYDAPSNRGSRPAPLSNGGGGHRR